MRFCLWHNVSAKWSLHWSSILITGLKLRVRTKKLIFLFLIQTYVVGTQKNRLNETVLLSTENIC